MSPISSNSNDMKKYCEVESLDDLIRQLHEIFESDNVNIEHVQMVMESYKSCPSEWRKFAKFDPYRYTRNLVDEGNGKFNLMILCWGEGHGSAVHDHADAHCFMKILQGELSEIRFDWPNDQETSLNEIGRTKLQTESVCYINDSMGLHRVENTSHTEPAVSLHLYCPPFSSCSMFDQRTGHRTKCQVAFWSKYGEKVNYGKPGSCSVAEPEDN